MMFISGGLAANLKIPDMEKEISVRGFELGYQLGKMGIPLESRTALKAAGELAVKLSISFLMKFIIKNYVEPELNARIYRKLVRRGIKSLQEGRL